MQVSINGSRNCISFLRESIAAMAMQAGMGFSRIVILVGACFFFSAQLCSLCSIPI